MKEQSETMPKVFIKDIKDIRNGIMPEACLRPTWVCCVAIHKDFERNRDLKISLNRCLPIEGYVYSNVIDKYIVKGFRSIQLDSVNVSYRVRITGVGQWHVFVPMPEKVLKRYMSPIQRRELALFKSGLRESGEEVTYEYVQMLGAYNHG